MLNRWVCAASIALMPCAVAENLDPDVVELGRQLFNETRFSNPATDMEVSCASCHATTDPLGSRAFTELFQRSWHPWRSEDPGRETSRNTPTLLDVGRHAFIHADGEFQTLEQQASGTYTGRNFGWLSGEKEVARARVAWVFEANAAMSTQFEKAFASKYDGASPEELIEHMARATADFMRTLVSSFDSPYDRFIEANGISPEPSGESTVRYAGTILERLYALTTNGKLKLVEGFDEKALEGYRVFMRTEGLDSVGNCVTCHVPPLFMDDSYHNTGVSEMEYDGIHGTDSFSRVEIPHRRYNANPPKEFGSSPNRWDKTRVDLGHWNFADMDTSPLYRDGDTPEEFFYRTVAVFKTPTLRHLGSTDPYMHSGEFDYVGWALMQKVEAAFLARMGQLRNGDEEMKGVHITRDDVPALVAFLNALNDAGERQIMEAPELPNVSYGGGRYRQEQ